MTKSTTTDTLDRGRGEKKTDASASAVFFLVYQLTAYRIAQKDNYSFSIDVKISEISAPVLANPVPFCTAEMYRYGAPLVWVRPRSRGEDEGGRARWLGAKVKGSPKKD